MNPEKGEGWRNIYCREDGVCLTIAVRNGWKEFNCEGCEGPGKQAEITTTNKTPITPIGAEQTRKEDGKMVEIKKKRCKKCGGEKDLLNDFAVNKATLDGRERFCKDCARQMRKDRKKKKLATGAGESGKRAYKRRKKVGPKRPTPDQPAELREVKEGIKTEEIGKGDRPMAIINQLLGIELINKSGSAYLLLRTLPESQVDLKVKLLEELKGLVEQKGS